MTSELPFLVPSAFTWVRDGDRMHVYLCTPKERDVFLEWSCHRPSRRPLIKTLRGVPVFCGYTYHFTQTDTLAPYTPQPAQCHNFAWDVSPDCPCVFWYFYGDSPVPSKTRQTSVPLSSCGPNLAAPSWLDWMLEWQPFVGFNEWRMGLGPVVAVDGFPVDSDPPDFPYTPPSAPGNYNALFTLPIRTFTGGALILTVRGGPDLDALAVHEFNAPEWYYFDHPEPNTLYVPTSFNLPYPHAPSDLLVTVAPVGNGPEVELTLGGFAFPALQSLSNVAPLADHGW